MKVIFTENVQGVAVRGDVKNVKNGFYRNFLMPFKKASPANAAMLKEWEERRKKLIIEREEMKKQFEEIKRRITGAVLTVEKKVTKKGTLYGGIKASDVAELIKKEFKVDVPETAVKIKAVIKSVGTYETPIHLGEGVDTTVTLKVVEKA